MPRHQVAQFVLLFVPPVHGGHMPVRRNAWRFLLHSLQYSSLQQPVALESTRNQLSVLTVTPPSLLWVSIRIFLNSGQHDLQRLWRETVCRSCVAVHLWSCLGPLGGGLYAEGHDICTSSLAAPTKALSLMGGAAPEKALTPLKGASTAGGAAPTEALAPCWAKAAAVE